MAFVYGSRRTQIIEQVRFDKEPLNIAQEVGFDTQQVVTARSNHGLTDGMNRRSREGWPTALGFSIDGDALSTAGGEFLGTVRMLRGAEELGQ